jgi:N-acetylneuraminate lyase
MDLKRSLTDRKNKLLLFSGPVVASVALFNENTGSTEKIINNLIRYVTYLSSIGVKGFYVHGTTGEGLSLNHEEKKGLTKNWCEVVKKVIPDALLIINVSSCCSNDTLDHVALCQTLDQVDAVACLPPIYHRPKDVDDLVKYLKLVSSVGPDLPLLYYNFPEMTNVNLPMDKLISNALNEIPNFAGLKFTSKNMAELAGLRRCFGTRVKLFAGYEEVSFFSHDCSMKTNMNFL